MRPRSPRVPALLTILLGCGFLQTPAWSDDPRPVGPDACARCHEAETRVWQDSPHARAPDQMRKNPRMREVLAATGGTTPETSPICSRCHVTRIPGGEGVADRFAGPSCESCHGNAADWLGIHSDHGPGHTRSTEPLDHRVERRRASITAGMRTGTDLFDIAMSCLECHGLVAPDVPPEAIARMFQAGHPVEPEYEFLQAYESGVRHRFYPVPVGEVNLEYTEVEALRTYVIGQAAQYVAARLARDRVPDPGYRAVQEFRAQEAAAILRELEDLPAVATLLAHPGRAAGRHLAQELKTVDLRPWGHARIPESLRDGPIDPLGPRSP